MVLYYQPELINEGLKIVTYNEEGSRIDFEILPSMLSVSLGYYDTLNEFKSIVSIVEEFTPLDIEQLDIENLILEIKYIQSYNPVDYYEVRNKVTIRSLAFHLRYEVIKASTRSSNLSLYRYNYFMPKWSTSYLNPISTYSKVFYPSFEYLDNILYKTRSDITRNISNTSIYHTRKVKKNILQIIQDNKLLTEVSSIDSTQVLNISLKNLNNISYTLFKYVSSTISFPFTNNAITPHLYLTVLDTDSYVKIKGYDFDNRYIEETIKFSSPSYKMSNFKFNIVLGIDSDSEYEITNHIDGKDKLQERSLVKFSFFTDEMKNYSFNTFKWMNNCIEEYTPKNEYEPIRRYNLDLVDLNPKIFLDLSGQVLIHSNNTLYTAVLEEPIDSLPLFHESNNNTTVVDIENNSKIKGDSFSFNINIKELLDKEEVDYIYLKLESNGKKYYLDNNFILLEKKEKFFITSTNNIFVDLKFEIDSYYALNVETEENTYTASTYTLTLKTHKVLENITKVFINNNKLYIERNNRLYEGLKVKNNYEYSRDKNLVTTVKDSPIKVIYTDFSRDTL